MADGGDQPFDLEKLQQLMELMEKHGLTEVSLRQGEEEWKLSRGGVATVAYAPAPLPTYAPAPAAAAPAAGAPAAAAPAADGGAGLLDIKSPTIGTFYSQPSPEDPPFVTVGSVVTPETIVCTVEAMKVFNQIPSGVSGTITAILVKAGDPVEFGQPLFKVRP